MTREEAIEVLENATIEPTWGGSFRATSEALDMAIEALEGVCFDEWCTDCKEYDTEKKCCPRFNRVIRGAMKRIPHDDGTLEVKVEDATKVGRVLISDDKHRGGLYYPDEDEPQKSYPTEWCEQCTLWEDNKCIGVAQCKRNIDALKQVMSEDLISRAEAIEALGEEPLVWCDEEYEIAERSQWRADIEAIKSVPSADRPRPIEPTITVDLESGVVPISACEPKEPKTIVYIDRRKGKWIDENNSNYANCSECGYQIDTHEERGYHNFCPNCGADMKGNTK